MDLYGLGYVRAVTKDYVNWVNSDDDSPRAHTNEAPVRFPKYSESWDDDRYLNIYDTHLSEDPDTIGLHFDWYYAMEL